MKENPIWIEKKDKDKTSLLKFGVHQCVQDLGTLVPDCLQN